MKERLVICNEEGTDGRARVTTDEERDVHSDSTRRAMCGIARVKVATSVYIWIT